jgi:hypothetical protein
VVQTFQGKSVIALFCLECRHAWSVTLVDLLKLMNRAF